MRIMYHSSVTNEILNCKSEADRLGKSIKAVEINETERHQLMMELKTVLEDNPQFQNHDLEDTINQLRDTGQCVLYGINVKYNGAAI